MTTVIQVSWRQRVCITTLTIILAIGLTTVASGQEVNPVSPELTSKLRELLRKEMLSIEQASQQILSALVAGEDARITKLAQQIHDSFILKQSMTPEDKQDLMAAVPEDFVKQDRAFHKIAAELAEAGREGDRAKQQVDFDRMINACSGCHALYATDRFPSFVE